MPKLLFLSRVAFICNGCFVLTWLLRYYPQQQQGQVASTIIVLGVGVAALLNALVTLAVLIYLLRYKQSWPLFPRWLIITNFIFFLFQLILIIT